MIPPSPRLTRVKVDHVKTETYGKQSVSYLGPKIWNSIPQEIKNVTTLAVDSLFWEVLTFTKFHISCQH